MTKKPPFIKRAQAVQDNNLYIVFGAKPPFTFLQESEQIIHSSEWTDYQLKHKVKIERVYVHLMTYQKIKWVRVMLLRRQYIGYFMATIYTSFLWPSKGSSSMKN